MVIIVGWVGNEPVERGQRQQQGGNDESVKEVEMPRMKTTTPSSRRLEQALRVFVGDLEALEGALLKFEEALLEYKEGAPEHQNGQNPRPLSPSEVCQELGEERTVVYLQEYMNRHHHLRLLGEEKSLRGR